MSELLRKLFHEKKPHAEGSGSVGVLVALTSPPDDSCLARLEKIGLTVTSVVGNKLTGEIAAEDIETLEADVSVVELERSVQLEPTEEGGE